MSCFEDDVVKELQKNLENHVVVEIAERNNFKNITAFIRAAEQVDVQRMNINSSQNNKPQPMQAVATNLPQERLYRILIKQTAKGKAYYEVSVKADCLDALKQNLEDASEIAIVRCQELNAHLMEEETTE